MIVKEIDLRLKHGDKQAFLEEQSVWTASMQESPGFRGVYLTEDPEDDRVAVLHCFWQDRASLNQFMAERHDALQQSTAMEATVSVVSTRVLAVSPHLQFNAQQVYSSSDKWREMLVASEAYRISIVLRLALEAGLFEKLGPVARRISSVAAELRLSPHHCRKLIDVLQALQLVVVDDDQVRLSPDAAALFRFDGKRALRNLFLHNAGREQLARWNELEAVVGLAPVHKSHELFLAAMRDIAHAGQAEAIAALFADAPPRRVLDVGGACGDNAMALAALDPSSAVDVLDIAESAELARAATAESRFASQVRFFAGDYRTELPAGPYDLVLVANVLRGETPAEARSLLGRCKSVLRSSGALCVVDLLNSRGEGDRTSDLLAALFGLHLPDAMVADVSEVMAMVKEAGFHDVEVHSFAAPRVASHAILASAAPSR